MENSELNKSYLEVIKLRNEGKNNTEISVILGKSKSWMAKSIGRINKIYPCAIKKGMTTHSHESKVEKLKAREIAIKEEEPNIRNIESLLRESYPKLFNDEHLPLAIGTGQVINEAGVLDDFTDLAKKTFFKRWVTRLDYFKACLLHQNRFDLEGNKVEKILQDHLTQAELAVKRREAKTNKKHSNLLYRTLKKHFFHLFNKSELVALSFDMDKQLLASPHLEGFSANVINKVLAQWKGRLDYQKAVTHQKHYTNIDGSVGADINQDDKLASIAKIKEITNIKNMAKPEHIEKSKISDKPLTEEKKEPIVIIKKRKTLSLSV